MNRNYLNSYFGQKRNLWINTTPNTKTYVLGLQPNPKTDKYYNQGENFILPGLNDPSFSNKLLESLIELNDRGNNQNGNYILYFLTECKYSVNEDQKNILKKIIEQYSIPLEIQKEIYNPGKHFTLICNFTFKYEKKEQQNYYMGNLINYRDEYKNRISHEVNNLNSRRFHTEHFNYEEKITLKVFKLLDFEIPNSCYLDKNLLSKLNEKYLFDRTSYSWYQFKNDIWIKLYFNEFKKSIFDDLKEYGIFKYNMTEYSRRNFYLYLRKNFIIGMNQLDITDKNFIPFQNGILDLNNVQLTPYSNSNSKNHRFFFKFGINFDPKAKMSKDFIIWLLQITKRDPLYINIIRNFLFQFITRDNKFKIALYLHNPSNSGINTFLKICEKIASLDGFVSTNFLDINDITKRRFIYNKNLIILKDNDTRRSKKSILKTIVNSEKVKINFSNYYKLTRKVKLNSSVLITSNHIWKGKDATIENIIYLPINKKEIQNSLIESSLPGFINWILDTPKNNFNLFENITQLNYQIDSYEESEERFNGLTPARNQSLIDLDYFKNYINIDEINE